MLLVAVVLLVFGQVLSHEFVEYDDDINVYRNPAFQPVTLEHVADLWRRPYEALYIPVTYTYFAVEVLLSPSTPIDAAGRALSPVVFHAGSIFLHCLCALLVFGLLRILVHHDAAAFLGSLLFALHPLQVESVAWISETKGLLSTAFGIAAVWFYLRFRESSQREAEGEGSASEHFVPYVAASICFLLALLSKPAAVAIPIMAFILDVGLLRRSWKTSVLALLPWLLLAGAIVIVSKTQQPGADLQTITMTQRVCIAGDSLAFYLGKFIAPWGLTPIYDRPLDDRLATTGLCWWWLVPLAFVVVVALLPGRRLGLVCIALFVVALLPVLGFIPFDYQRLSTVADRYVYLAMFAPALAVAAIIAAFPNRLMYTCAAILLLTLAGLSFDQSSHWQNDATLFSYALSQNPNSAEMHNSLGNLAYREEDLAGAESHFRQALQIRPQQHFAHRNLGQVLSRRGRWDEAIKHYRQAIAARPDFADAHRSLGQAFVHTNQLAAAVDEYRETLRILPGYREVYEELGVTLLNLGRPSEAEAHYRQAAARFPNWAHAHANLAVALAQQGKLAEAAQQARRAIELDPTMSDARDTLEKIETLQKQPSLR
ncbi:MAG: tetratricopeptide repeat protein [Pirellulales bacterium]